MTEIIVLRLYKRNWLGLFQGINPEVKEIFEKRLVIRWQKIPDNKILIEVKRID